MKAIEPSSIKTLKRQKLAFKKMENINAFLEAIEKYGVAKHDSFQTVDLYERTNLTQVVLSIHALGRKVSLTSGIITKLIRFLLFGIGVGTGRWRL
jgi:hypothetical protein